MINLMVEKQQVVRFLTIKKLTAANKNPSIWDKGKKLPILKNEKSVIVRVNDRGPFSKKRAFDLSKAAF